MPMVEGSDDDALLVALELRIRVHGRPGQGSSFTPELPREVVE